MPLFSQYRAMWLFAMFDLPVNDKKSRRAYTQFRKALLKQGFTMMQYSIYARQVPREEADLSLRRRVRLSLPDVGQVRLMSITDRQFAKMDVFIGRKRKDPEPVPLQRLLF